MTPRSASTYAISSVLILVLFLVVASREAPNDDEIECYVVPESKIVFEPSLRVEPECMHECLQERFGESGTEMVLVDNGHKIIAGAGYVFVFQRRYDIGAIDSERVTRVTAGFVGENSPEVSSNSVRAGNGFYLDGSYSWLFAGEYVYADNIYLDISFQENRGNLRAKVRSKFAATYRAGGESVGVNLNIACPVTFRQLSKFDS